MIQTKSCPKNQIEFDEASKQLGCGNDQYGNKQYMCLPNVEKTSLIEFCHDDVMGIQEEGNCLELNVSEGKIIQTSCVNFSFGCPKGNFWNHQLFHYPACQEINTEHHCYASLPSCPPTGLNSVVDEINTYTYMYIIFTLLVIAALISGVVLIFKIRKKIKRRGLVKKEIENSSEHAETDITTVTLDDTGGVCLDDVTIETREENEDTDIPTSGSSEKEITNTEGHGKEPEIKMKHVTPEGLPDEEIESLEEHKLTNLEDLAEKEITNTEGHKMDFRMQFYLLRGSTMLSSDLKSSTRSTVSISSNSDSNSKCSYHTCSTMLSSDLKSSTRSTVSFSSTDSKESTDIAEEVMC